MSNIRLFFSASLSTNMTDKLDKSQSYYLNKVMRVKENDFFSLFNSNGAVSYTHLTLPTKRIV